MFISNFESLKTRLLVLTLERSNNDQMCLEQNTNFAKFIQMFSQTTNFNTRRLKKTFPYTYNLIKCLNIINLSQEAPFLITCIVQRNKKKKKKKVQLQPNFHLQEFILSGFIFLNKNRKIKKIKMVILLEKCEYVTLPTF